MSKQKQIHYGEILEKATRESGMALSVIAKKLGRSRNHIYNLFQANKISTDVLLEIGKIINHDFTSEIIVLQKIKNKEEDLTKKEIDFWKDKYYTLLEEHSKLMKLKVKKFFSESAQNQV